MSSTPHIIAISAFAQDILVDIDSQEKKYAKGGPARWIKNAAEYLKRPISFLEEDKEATTTVYTKDGVAQYGVLNAVNPMVITEALVADGFIINVMQDEFNLDQMPLLNGVIFADLGSYTRTGEMGKVQEKKTMTMPSVEVRNSLDIIKLNDLEFPYFPDAWKEEQKQKRILIHTLGARGLEAWNHGKYIRMEAPNQKLKSTIGAGDTFGCGFFFYYLEHDHNVEHALVAGSQLVQELMNK